MKISTSAGYALSVAATFSMLTACGGPNQLASPLTASEGSARSNVRPNNAPYVFVSDHGSPSQKVRVFNLNSGTLAFTLSGFSDIGGECVDSSGNVYVTDGGSSKIKEYSNGGTLLRTLNMAPYKPVACAVRSGASYRVAVAQRVPPLVSVFDGTTTTVPTNTYPTTVFGSLAYLGFFNNSTLFLDGAITGNFEFGRMSNGGNFTAIPVTGGAGPGSAGGVQQPPGKNYLAVGDASSNTVYHIKVTGALVPPFANNPNPTVLTGSCGSFTDFFILLTGNQRTLLNPESCTAQQLVHVYLFPQGGPPLSSYVSPLTNPVGVVVSQ